MKKISILTLFVLIFGFLSSISCGYLISSAVVSSFGYTSNITTQQQYLYAISIVQPNSTEISREYIESLQSQNGAGYVYRFENKQHLISSIYENINDAELVKNNISTSGIACDIITISLPPKSIEGNFSTDEKTTLENALNCDLNIFKKLYDIAISLDTGIYDTTKAKLLCNAVYSECISAKSNIETLFKGAQANNLKSDLDETSKHLFDLKNENYQTKNQTFSSLIKQTYCKIILKLPIDNP